MFLPEIVRKLSIEYPGDVGVFVVYFMNVIDLDPGDAIFIDSNVPHAYLSGGKYLVALLKGLVFCRAGFSHQQKFTLNMLIFST